MKNNYFLANLGKQVDGKSLYVCATSYTSLPGKSFKAKIHLETFSIFMKYLVKNVGGGFCWKNLVRCKIHVF